VKPILPQQIQIISLNEDNNNNARRVSRSLEEYQLFLRESTIESFLPEDFKILRTTIK
jgi:hypothetical protein